MKEIVKEMSKRVRSTAGISTNPLHLNQVTRIILNDVFLVMQIHGKISMIECTDAMCEIEKFNP